MFMRETEGVYQFGTKRVMVKVEKDAIKIRVGGGFLSIDEFLDQYTPVEPEKLERKDPLKRLSEKIAIQKSKKQIKLSIICDNNNVPVSHEIHNPQIHDSKMIKPLIKKLEVNLKKNSNLIGDKVI